jgi:pilus assembly protein TadC
MDPVPSVGPVVPAGSDPSTVPSVPATDAEERLPQRTVRVAAALGALTTVVVVGDLLGLIGGALVAVALTRLLPRIEPAAVRRRRAREVAELPLAADLLAAVLRAGAPIDRAVLTVAETLDGPLGDRLRRVGRALRLGAGPTESWAALTSVPGAERLVAAVVRSSASGSALAGALTRLADDLRDDRITEAEAAARRSGVLLVLPLGLCFLPAFILAGLVPVIVAVLGDVW